MCLECMRVWLCLFFHVGTCVRTNMYVCVYLPTNVRSYDCMYVRVYQRMHICMYVPFENGHVMCY